MRGFIFIKMSEHQHIVSEVYDLINTSNFHKRGNEYLLMKPNNSSNLSSIRFRGFKPILKNSISNINIDHMNIDIYPMIFERYRDEETQSFKTAYYPNYYVMNYWNGVGVAIDQQSYQCSLAGTIEELVDDINNIIAAYCSNLKPHGTIRYMLQNPETTEPFFSLGYDSGEVDIAITDYYEHYKPTNNPISAEEIYTWLTYDSAETTFYTNNLIFQLIKSDDPSVSIFLTFCIDVYFNPAELINVSLFRQFFNCVEYIEQNPDERMFMQNSCTSTDPDFDNAIKLLYYKYSGMEMALFCVYMKNLSGVVYVNVDEAQVYMKEITEPCSMNYIPVQIKHIDGSEIETSLLEDLFSSILIQIDFVYNARW